MNNNIEKFIQDIFNVKGSVASNKKLKEWKNENPWFGRNPKLTMQALIVLDKLKEEGILPNSPGFWYAFDVHVHSIRNAEYLPTVH